MATDLSKHIKTNPELELGGVWVDWMGDIKLKIAALNNPRYTARMHKLAEEHLPQVRAGGAIAEQAKRKMAVICMGETILVGWQNLADEGQAIEYTPEASVRLLEKYSRLYQFVEGYADNIQPYLVAADDDAPNG